MSELDERVGVALVRQQAALARFGELALKSEDLDEILTEACRLVSQALGTELSKVLEVQADGRTLLVKAGVGWNDGVVGRVRIKADEDSSEGHALATGEPVISTDTAQERRFTFPPFIVEHGVRALVNVVILGGREQRPYGVLEVDTRVPREFGQADIAFLRTYANLIAGAVDRLRELLESRHREAFSQGILAASPDCVKVLSQDGTILFINRHGLEMNGIDNVVEAVGQPYASFWPEGERAKLAGGVTSAMRGETARIEGFCPAPDGSARWLEVSFSPLAAIDGEAPRLLGISRDITERRTAEAALRSSEDRYRQLFNSIDQGFCVVEMIFEGDRPVDYRFIEVNAAFERHTGLVDPTGKTIRSLVPNHEQYWFDVYGRVATGGTPERFESQAAGLGRWYSVEAFRVDAPALRRVGVLFNDVTDDKTRERLLAQSRDELEGLVTERTADLAYALEALRTESADRARAEAELRQSQKMEAVGQLTGGLAHDFNNLLTGITGSLELLQSRLAVGRTDEADRYVTAAQSAAKRAAALTHRLLAFSRRQTLDPKPTDVNRLVAGMEELIRRTMSPEMTVEVAPESGLWNTLVDPSQLENALLNLVINARDAMPDSGTLVVQTRNCWLDDEAAREQEVLPGQYICLSVQDTGSGMPPDVIARAFDPFFTTKPIGQGTGLGLSMIYGFARQSGGQVTIASELGHGTTVDLYLPRHFGDADAVEVGTALSDAPRARGNETVLVVDDEPTVRMLVVEVLEELGYTAIEAADAAGGLRVIATDIPIDLLVTDVGLPGGINGRQLADAARAARAGLRVLFITGYAEAAVISNGQLEPGMYVMTKPFTMEALAARIRELIAR